MFTGSEPFSVTQLFTFLKEHSKVYILAPGCDEKLDKLSEKFMKDVKKRSDILKSVEEVIGKIECEEVKNVLDRFNYHLLNSFCTYSSESNSRNFTRRS